MDTNTTQGGSDRPSVSFPEHAGSYSLSMGTIKMTREYLVDDGELENLSQANDRFNDSRAFGLAWIGVGLGLFVEYWFAGEDIKSLGVFLSWVGGPTFLVIGLFFIRSSLKEKSNRDSLVVKIKERSVPVENFSIQQVTAMATQSNPDTQGSPNQEAISSHP